MRRISSLIALGLCLATGPALATCLDTEAPPVGSTAGVGLMLTVPDGQVFLRPFLSASGWITTGISTVVASTYAAAGAGGAQERQLDNISEEVVPNPPVIDASFAYADFGGDVNLQVNGVLVRLPDLSAAPAALGGVNIVVNRISFPFWHYGTVTLHAPAPNVINDFRVGGQEFFVDNICW